MLSLSLLCNVILLWLYTRKHVEGKGNVTAERAVNLHMPTNQKYQEQGKLALLREEFANQRESFEHNAHINIIV